MAQAREDFKEKDELGSSEAQSSVTAVLQAQEPPDGGYGWVIVGCIFMANGKHLFSFGVVSLF